MTYRKLRLDLHDTYSEAATLTALAAFGACRSSIAVFLIAQLSQERQHHDR